MSLSTFQRAVLQEMGIPVWVNQSSLQDENSSSVAANVASKRSANASFATANSHSPAMPSNEEKQSRLAQLRAQVSSDSSKASGQTKAAGQNASGSRAEPSAQSLSSVQSQPSAAPQSVTNTASKNVLKSESINSSSQSSSFSSNSASSGTAAMVELTQVQRLQGKQWLQDLDVALAYLQLSLTSTQVKIGQAVAVTYDGIVLPSAPHLLTAAIQKQLWKMLCALSNNASSPEAL
ncbi:MULTISPECIES: hypothetical protein [unclassified Alteromonas]|uniref:hypothetical protein n=1 Tax=unclassified Alteromonas TaxID=2614992 RepID=UPI00135A1252|nr:MULTISPECIES: hypothetical protein [unclassified Alteromonas]